MAERPLSTKALKRGDALYFDMDGGKRDANHTGLFIGNGKMIVAPSTGKKIQIQEVGQY